MLLLLTPIALALMLVFEFVPFLHPHWPAWRELFFVSQESKHIPLWDIGEAPRGSLYAPRAFAVATYSATFKRVERLPLGNVAIFSPHGPIIVASESWLDGLR